MPVWREVAPRSNVSSMARSSERDILQNIQRQIQDFSGGLSEGEPAVAASAPALAVTVLPDLYQRCEAEVRELEKEIQELEANKAKAAMGKNDKIKALNDMKNILPRSGADTEELQADISRLEKEVDLLVSITGVTISKTTCNVTDVGDDFLQKHHVLQGSCHDMQFKVTFDVEENWESEGDSTARLLNVEVKVPDPDQEYLAPVLQSLEPLGSLTLVFRVLTSFAEWKSQMESVITDIMERYPEVTEVEDGNTLVVRPPQSQGCQWRFQFGVHFSGNFTASSKVDLEVKAPAHVADTDVDGVLPSARTNFKKMQKTLGASAAVEVLIGTLLQ